MKSFKDTDIGREFLAGKIGIRCDTKEEYDRLMQMCEAAGLLWNGGERPCKNSQVSAVASQRAIKLATNSSWHKGAIYYRNANESLNDGIEAAPFSSLCAEPEKPAPKFKVGDIVRGIDDKYGVTNQQMKRGEVVRVFDDGMIGVRVLEHSGGYKGSTIFPVYPEHFELVNPEKPAPATRKIIITTDGKTTTARLMEGKTTIKTATATCSPSDKFSFEYGASLACNRLCLDADDKSWYSDKAKVLDEVSAWLKGAARH